MALSETVLKNWFVNLRAMNLSSLARYIDVRENRMLGLNVFGYCQMVENGSGKQNSLHLLLVQLNGGNWISLSGRYWKNILRLQK